MMERWAEQMAANRAAAPRPDEVYGAQARANRYEQDPYRAAQSDMEAARARGGTPNIDAFKAMNRIPELSPEEILASQGNTATNQWMSMRGQPQGGVAGGGAPGINPDELRRLNAARASQSYNLPQGRYV
jgi:hypothetical protein